MASVSRVKHVAVAIAGAAVCAMALGLNAQSQRAGARRLTIERMTSARPSLEGTAPMNPVWSPDSTRLAFMWDAQGAGDRNIWIVDASGGEPKQITDLARQMPGAPRGPMNADQLREAAMMLMRGGGLADMIWTPDSSALVISHQGQLVKLQADGSGPKPLAEGRAPRMNLAFSPDGTRLSFTQAGNLFFLDLATGEAKQMTKPEGNIRFNAYKWSPDGKTIALLFNEPPGTMPTTTIPNFLTEELTMVPVRRQTVADEPNITGRGGVAILSLADGDLRLVRPQGRRTHRINEFSWSPDSRRVLVDEFSMDTVHRWMSIVEAEDGSIRELLHDERATRVTPFWHSAWRTDGQAVISLTNTDGWHHIYSVPVSGGQPTLLTPGDFEVVAEGLAAYMELIRPTKEIFFVSNQKSPYERHVYKVSENGGPMTQVTKLPGIHRPIVSPNGRYVATLRDEDLSPTDLYIADVRSPSPERQVTRSPAKEFYEYTWVKPRYVTFKSHLDGATLHGRLIEPPNLDRSKKYPVILGSVYRDTARNSWGGLLEQYLAIEAQYIQFKVDMRGSIGYGRDFQEKIFKSVGGIEVDDVESAVRYLKTLPYVDADRFGIHGGSYGGLVTLMAVFKKPTLFKAAVAQCPASNLWHGPGLRYARTPQENPDAYKNGSPISFGEDLQARLLLIHGTQDTNVLFQDTLKLAEKLVTLGKNFDMVIIPSAGHCGGPNINQGWFTTTKLVEHFDRFVGRGPRPANAPSQ